jgi:penicillin-binding protein 1A
VLRFIRRFVRALAVIILCLITVPAAAGATIMASFLYLPLPAVLPAPKPQAQSQGTKLFLPDGTQIGEFKDVDLKIPVQPKDIPDTLKKAVIAAEDRNFYNHGGVDIRGSARALVADLQGKRITQGGSTITQQYVKKTYTNQKRNVARKIREAILASQLERTMPKEEILFNYLSIVYFGDQAYGAGAAAQTYFRKPVSQLTLSEAAMMAGVIPSPTAWAPREHLADAEFHRQLVLKLMLEQGVITQQEHDTALAQHLFLVGNGKPPANATLVYPAEQVTQQYPDFADYAYKYLVAKYGPDMVLHGGLQVTVTMDPKLQDLALKAVRNMAKGTKEDLELSLVSVQPQTGFVQALVGGKSFGSGKYASTNLALGGCPARPADMKSVSVPATCWDGTTTVVSGGTIGRQAGSSFKPFTLATAFSKGIPPTKVYPAPVVYQVPGCRNAKDPKQCQIRNAADGEGGGSMNLRQATTKSVNTVFAGLIHDVGVKDTVEMAKKLGITSTYYSPATKGISYTLGVDPVSPLEMASAYGVFDNHGKRAAPTPVVLVKDANGKVLEDNTEAAKNAPQVIPANIADNVTDLLRGPVGPGGTAYPRADIGRPQAGKTGTTDDYVDAWFVGYTPTLSTAVWMGYAENEKTSMHGIKGVGTVFGGTLPAQTWHDFMKPALAGVAPTNFDEPAPIVPITRDLNKEARNGMDPGPRMGISDTPSGGPYVLTPGTPQAVAPTTTTTEPPFDPNATTTTTTAAPPPPTTTAPTAPSTTVTIPRR